MSLAAGAEVELRITALGAMGDGVAELDGQTVRLEGGLPGERWRARLLSHRRDGWDAVPLAALEGSVRAEPPCRHFDLCGGCRLQHAPHELYVAFKRQRVAAALARRGLGEVPVAEPLLSPPGARRRLRLAWLRQGGGTVLGLRQRRSHRIVDLETCPVAAGPLVAALPALRRLLGGLDLFPREGEASLTLTAGGIDLLLDAARQPGLEERRRLADFAQETDAARLSLAIGGAAEIVVAPRPPVVELSGVAVSLPPGAFLQATAEGESALAAGVVAALRPRDRVLDLFAGLGTLSLAALAAGARSVHAIEGEAAACLTLAATHRSGLSTERRDLARRPLAAAELARFDLAVLDPPRSGAVDQARELAGSAIGRIAYASCDPESFARDARILVDGGYVLEHVQPIDQFLWSAEVELVSRFARTGRRRRA